MSNYCIIVRMKTKLLRAVTFVLCLIGTMFSPQASAFTRQPEGPPEAPNAQTELWQTEERSEESPNQSWVVTTSLRLPTPANPRHQYNAKMVVARTDNSKKFTVMDRWSDFGLGYTIPQPFRWSRDERYFYFTNLPVSDGCGGLSNASDLQRVDLRTVVPAEDEQPP